MSSFWSTIIGAVVGGILAIAGGFLAAWWQTKRADDIARRIRLQDRHEQVIFAFTAKAREVCDLLGDISRTMETSPLTAQYNAARQALDELTKLWQTKWAAAVYETQIRDFMSALVLRTSALLPGGGEAMQYQESEPAARAAHFARDLRELYGLADKLWKALFMEALRLGHIPDS